MDFSLIWWAFLWIVTGVEPDRETLAINWDRFRWEKVPLLLTLELVVLALAIGLALALLLALMRLSKSGFLQALAGAYVFVFRGTPLLVQIFLIYYGSGQFRPFWQEIGLWGLFRDPFWPAIMALALNTAAYTSEIIRGGILSVPYGEIEAARAFGMSRTTVFRRITVPIAIRQALPAYGNEMILMVKSTSLASTITIVEITHTARLAIAKTFAPIEVFIAAGALYLLLNFALSRLVRWGEWRLTPHLRARPDPLGVADPKAPMTA